MKQEEQRKPRPIRALIAIYARRRGQAGRGGAEPRPGTKTGLEKASLGIDRRGEKLPG